MTETSTETEHQDAAPTSEQKPAEKTLTQSEVDRIVAERVAREKQKFADYDDLKAAATRLKDIENANKSEQQKLADQVAELTKALADKDAEVEKATLASLKASVAAAKRVPASRLHGITKEELEADADAYLAEVAEVAAARDAGTKRKPPAAGLKSGASSSGDTSANPQERAAAALRALRRGGE
ncbi:hypothetical protein [Nocardia abscessus]|uniref:hypothetical protein n=1 Tax=Nocardia abscessus TaxID=120957 RepID=UPI0024562153|nr:hypothetical protein [Nocardia abscessus]